jgi:hypothetical protein
MIPPCFRQIWLLDTEYSAPDGERPRPICLVAREHCTGRVVRLWLWGRSGVRPPFECRDDVLVVCYHAPAEWSVYLALGWRLPSRIVDLRAEYCWMTSGWKFPARGQLDAMESFGLPHMESEHKTAMRCLCIRGGPFTPAEQQTIVTYCGEDVDGLAVLFEKMAPRLQWPQALARGRYTAAVARVEAGGVPIDRRLYRRLRGHRDAVCRELIAEADRPFGVYDGTRFDSDSFERYLVSQNIPWTLTETGLLATREDVFEEAVEVYPQLRPLYELRWALGQLKDDGGLSVGSDGRNRSPLWPFSASSGRNCPSTTKFVFGKSVAFRSFIKPARGWAVAYVDWCQQEFAIAGVLSDDHNMRQAYLSGDPYLEFAKQAGVVPSSATKETHREVRELFKTCMLGVNYGMGEVSLARRIKKPLAHARELLSYHHQIYRRFWRWIEQVQDQAMLAGRLRAALGWQVNVGPEANWRSLRNFPMQGNGSEMLRLAVSLAVERGVLVVAPVHDAMLIEARVGDLKDAVRTTREAMVEASRVVLDGFEIRTDVQAFRYPHRYRDSRGDRFWALLMGVLDRVVPQSPPL